MLCKGDVNLSYEIICIIFWTSKLMEINEKYNEVLHKDLK